MLRRIVSCFALLALSLTSRGAALAQEAPEPPAPRAPRPPAPYVPKPPTPEAPKPPTPEELALTEERRAADEARVDLYALTYSGTRLVGEASRGRYRLGGASLGLGVDRFFGVPGFAARIEGFSALYERTDLDFFRLEGAGALRLARWGGDVPGGVAIYAGIGGDVGRYWYSEDGRFYGFARAKARFWLTPETPLQVSYTAIPAAIATGDVSLHEHRVEIASGYSFFGFGARMVVTVASGGSQDRTFVQNELGGFVSFGVFE